MATSKLVCVNCFDQCDSRDSAAAGPFVEEQPRLTPSEDGDVLPVLATVNANGVCCMYKRTLIHIRVNV